MSLANQLSHLERSDLIQLAAVQPELEYLFRHTLIKDAVYQSMVRVNLRRLHRLVGEVLEDRFAGRDAQQTGETYYTLARHFSEAGDVPRALRYYILAGDAAAAVYANQEAAQRYAQALAAGPLESLEPDVLLHLTKSLGRVQELSGDYTSALETYAHLEVQGQRRADPVMVLLALSSSAIIHAVPSYKYDAERADALLQRALPLAINLGDRANEARLLWIRLLLELSRARVIEAVQAGEAGLQIARELNLREQIALTQTDLGRAYVGLGAMPQGGRALDEARAIWRELGNRPMLAESLTNAAVGHFLRGEYAQALVLTAESRAVAQSIGNGWGQAYSLMINSLVAIEQGDLQTAIDAMESSLRLADEGGFVAPALEMRAGLAYTYALLGFTSRAVLLVEAALESARATGLTEIGGAYAILAFIELQQGNPTAARAHLAQARETLAIQDIYTFGPVFVGIVSGRVALMDGNHQAALEAVSPILEAQQAAGIESFADELGYIQARALDGLGCAAEAEQLLATLSARGRAQGALRALWAIQAMQAEIAERQGRPAEAYSLRQSARVIIESMAGRFTDPVFRDAFLRQPDVVTLLAAAQTGQPTA